MTPTSEFSDASFHFFAKYFGTFYLNILSILINKLLKLFVLRSGNITLTSQTPVSALEQSKGVIELVRFVELGFAFVFKDSAILAK
jgi:hypothetical protein